MGDYGRIEVILGNMYSGKTPALIDRMGRYRAEGEVVQIFKPALDDRFGLSKVQSHNQAHTEAYDVSDIGELLKKLQSDVEVIGIEEAQFFPGTIIPFCVDQANSGRIVVAAALYHDFRGQPFPFKDSARTVFDLAAIADEVSVLTSKCEYPKNGTRKKCGQPAPWVQRFINGEIAPKDSPTIMVGAHDSYSVRCRQHFVRYD